MEFRSKEVRETAAERHGLVTVEDLRELGLRSSSTSSWVAQGRLVRLAPRVYLLPELLDDWSHLAAICLSTPSASASHRAAARLWDLDGVEVELIEISVPTAVKVRRGVVHRTGDLAAFDVTEVEGIRCTDPTRTLVDLGAVVDDGVVERALECALRRRLTSVRRLEWRLDALAGRGRPGPRALRRVLARRPGGAPATESDLETRFVQCLRAGGVDEPQRQHRISLPGGGSARLDLAYPAARLFVELDGWASHGSKGSFERDRRRQNQAVLAGWRPLRFTWRDVEGDPARVAVEVREALACRG